jgi:hypothetical protein
LQPIELLFSLAFHLLTPFRCSFQILCMSAYFRGSQCLARGLHPPALPAQQLRQTFTGEDAASQEREGSHCEVLSRSQEE